MSNQNDANATQLPTPQPIGDPLPNDGTGAGTGPSIMPLTATPGTAGQSGGSGPIDPRSVKGGHD